MKFTHRQLIDISLQKEGLSQFGFHTDIYVGKEYVDLLQRDRSKYVMAMIHPIMAKALKEQEGAWKDDIVKFLKEECDNVRFSLLRLEELNPSEPDSILDHALQRLSYTSYGIN